MQGAYIENSDGLYTPTGVRVINPPELNWAVWSQIIHGVRWLIYFGTTNNHRATATFGFPKTIYGGQSISTYNQVKATNGLIRNLARIINSPFALNYASVSPAGYTFPTLHLVLDNGIEIMCKWYLGGIYTNSSGTFPNGFYIFADVRGSVSQVNISATFTVNDPVATSVNVVGEGRSIPIVGGQFTDTFATAYTVHIYQVVG